jgi:hypothetical protein
MLEPQQVEDLIRIVNVMERSVLTERLLDFHGSFPVDFTDRYLASLSTDRLRHIFVALCLQHSHFPGEISTAA